MHDLAFMGLNEDRTRLVLVGDAGEEFTVAADARLRAALRNGPAHPGQLETQMESALRPRDIQARIRSGEDPESVAAAAQTSVEKIMVFATPVLAERAHIAGSAQRASIRRRNGAGPSRPLGDAVAERLRASGVDPDSVEWDAWRREDGRWTLVAEYPSPQRGGLAQFVYDAPGRYVVPDGEEARWLVEEPSPAEAPAAATRRLTAVASDTATTGDGPELGDDAISMVADSAGQASHDAAATGRGELAAPDERTVDLGEAAGPIRAGARPRPEDDAEAGASDADWIATQATERPAAPTLFGSAAAEDASAAPGESGADAQQSARRPARRPKRASVPSWDEIMFGGGRAE